MIGSGEIDIDGVTASGAVEPVLLVGGLELFEVERRGVAHQPEAGIVAVALAEQVAHQCGGAAEQVRQDAQGRFAEHEKRHMAEPSRRDPIGHGWAGMRQAGLGHHGIDDQLADVEGGGGQERAGEPQRDREERQRGARAPHEAEQARQVAQGADAVA